MAEKLKQVGKYWGSSHQNFEGYGRIDIAELRPFDGTHPAIMAHWLETDAEHFFVQDPDYKPSRRDRRNRLRFWIEEELGIEISKKHYRPLIDAASNHPYC